MTKHARRRLATAMMVLASLVPKAAQAQAIAPAAAPPDLIGRIFSGEFATRFPPPPRWFGSGATYVTTEPTSTPGARGMDVVDTATGRRRDVLITAAQLTPPGHSERSTSTSSPGLATTRASRVHELETRVADQLSRRLLAARSPYRAAAEAGR